MKLLGVIREIELINLLFDALSQTEESPDQTLKQLAEIYGKDFVDVCNCYTDVWWSDIDKTNRYEIIYQFVKSSNKI